MKIRPIITAISLTPIIFTGHGAEPATTKPVTKPKSRPLPYVELPREATIPEAILRPIYIYDPYTRSFRLVPVEIIAQLRPVSGEKKKKD